MKVTDIAELIRGTLHSASIHIEEIADAVDALARLADSGRCACGASGVTLRTLIVDGVGVFACVASRSTGCESDLQVGRSCARRAGGSSRAEAFQAQ